MRFLFHLAMLAVCSFVCMQPASTLAAQTNNVSSKVWLPPELQDFLNQAEEFTLFSLEPEPDFVQKSTNTFQNHVILGQIQINLATTRASLIDALNEGIGDMQPAPSLLPDCFNPRHGIRVRKGNETIEFSICFECRQIQVSSNKGKSWFFPTSKRPAATFNSVLKKNGVPLAKN